LTRLPLCSPALFLCSVLQLAAQGPPNPEKYDITFADIANQRNYDQPLRPQFHYTPIQGHTGDATGLIYYEGEYHLFTMFDEWSRRRLAHKRWGHAVSPDLVHWNELPPVLDTIIDNRPGSGSGVVDWNDSSGLRRGPEKTLLIYYTDYKRGTCMAYSRDRGRTWERHPANPIIPGAEDERDPTVFWYSPAGEWRMIRYEKKGFVFYSSRDLLKWTRLSRIDGFFECPDLMELPVLNHAGENRWVLIDGDGSYFIGRFDGTTFHAESERLKAEYSKVLYATQTWKLTMDGGPAYQMGWMRYPDEPRLVWHGQESFPVELTLRRFPEGIRLCRMPVNEIRNLRIGQQRWKDLIVAPGTKPLDGLKNDLIDLTAQIQPDKAGAFGLRIRGEELRYSVADQTLRLGNTTAPLPLNGKPLRLRVLVDRSSIEAFADEGQVSLSLLTLREAPLHLSVFAEGGSVKVSMLEANVLESIWKASGNR
jgi:sucrose-6-phosphate hydrolase SacC (GH32 family)